MTHLHSTRRVFIARSRYSIICAHGANEHSDIQERGVKLVGGFVDKPFGVKRLNRVVSFLDEEYAMGAASITMRVL